MTLTDEIVDSVMRPFDGDFGPAGPDGRNAADETLAEEFRGLKRERKAISRAERGSRTPEDGEDPPDIRGRWAALGDDSVRYLTERSKDLEILAILVEASVRADGLPGLARALELQRRFVEEFWERGMFPIDDPGDVTARFHPLTGLSGGGVRNEGSLLAPLRQTPLAGGLLYVDKVAAEAKFKNAQSDSTDPESRAKLQHSADAAFEGFRAVARGVDGASAQASIDLLERSEREWRATLEFIAKHTDSRALGSAGLTEELKAIREWLTGLFGNRLAGAEAAGAEGPGGQELRSDTGSTPGPGGTRAIAGRDNALITMLAIAEFFEKTEPLSPIGPALRSLHRRAKLSFDDLVAELLPESVSREAFYTRLGIKPPASEE
ncbi:MAG TPA: type VI secretion system ImpA family N-terminal domain-containing protein [Allosphingosinicella sp.]|jgi:type VI secretion system protein ImpA